MEIKRK